MRQLLPSSISSVLKHACLLLLVCFRSGVAVGQENTKGQRVHFLSSFNYKKLTHALTKNASTDQEKADNISHWITRHIRYDKKAYIRFKPRRYKPNRVLRSRKAVCEGYSHLFTDMCREAGISSAVVHGYGKDWFYDFGDTFFPDDHAWSAYRIDNKWHLSDLTWASGGLVTKFGPVKFLLFRIHLSRFPFRIKYVRSYDPKYVDANPKEFVTNHLPMVNYWQLLDSPVSIFDFENFSKEAHLLHYQDSVLGNSSVVRACKDCDDMESVGYDRQMQTEGIKQLEDNFRNTATYMQTVNNYLAVNGTTVMNDTVRLKQELFYYNDLYTTALCNVENAKKDYELQHQQNKNKVRLFKAYNDSIHKLIKKMYRSETKLHKLSTNILILDKKIFNGVATSARFARMKGVSGIVPKPNPTKAQDKKRKQAEKKMNTNGTKALSKIETAIASLDLIDSVLVHDTLAFPETFRHMAGALFFSVELKGLRKNFNDFYDLPVLNLSDSVENRTYQAYRIWKATFEPNTARIHKEIKKARKNMKDGWKLMLVTKSNLREAARNDRQLKSWRETNQDIDSLILEFQSSLVDSMYKLQYKRILNQKTILHADRKLMNRLSGSVSKEAFYDQSRHALQEYYYRRRYMHYRSEAKMIAKRIGKQKSKIEKQLNSLRK
ncbi:MAG: hypothetical protein JST26_16125 [Bacteroidetes bacterium]|nr:hypothetical protein [Bacteroidota bacterium]